MVEFIQYNLQGDVKLKTNLDFTQNSFLGQKTRITINNDRQYTGFMNFTGKTMPGTLQPAENPTVLELKRFDIDPQTKKVRSDNFTSIFIPSNCIIRVEAILYSNPRWGHYPNNEFQFNHETPEGKKAREEFNRQFVQMLAKKGIKLKR